MKWIYFLVFNFLSIIVYGQNFSGYTIFPNNIPADSVKVTLQGEEVPASYTIYPVTYNPLATNGTSVSLSDDSNVGPFNIGFNFKYFGTSYSQFRICTNGFITFGDPSGRYSPGSFPDASSPNGVIATYWTDLYPTSGYYCRYRTEGTAPYRKLIVTWHVTYYSAKSTWVDIQISLEETTNAIQISILNQGKVQTATQGVENLTGTAAFTPPGRNLASFNGAGTTYELVPATAVPGWQDFDSTYTTNGSYSLNGVGNNYNYRVRVEPPTYKLDSMDYTNILYHILHPDDISGLELTSMDFDSTSTITISDYLYLLNNNEFDGAVFTPSELNTMQNTQTTVQVNTSRDFEVDRDFIIMYPAILTKSITTEEIK